MLQRNVTLPGWIACRMGARAIPLFRPIGLPVRPTQTFTGRGTKPGPEGYGWSLGQSWRKLRNASVSYRPLKAFITLG